MAERDPSMGVILETLNDNMKLLLEGHEVMQTRIDKLDIRMGRVEGKIDNLEVKFDAMEEKFDDLAKDVRQKADKKDVIALANRVTKLEIT